LSSGAEQLLGHALRQPLSHAAERDYVGWAQQPGGAHGGRRFYDRRRRARAVPAPEGGVPRRELLVAALAPLADRRVLEDVEERRDGEAPGAAERVLPAAVLHQCRCR